MNNTSRNSTLSIHALWLALALAWGWGLASAAPSAAAASQPAGKVAPPAKRAGSAPAGKLGVKPDGTPIKMPLAPHVGVPGVERLGVTDRAARPGKLVDINSASVAELKTLPGVGDAEAQRIVAGRPYRVKTDLVAKNVLVEGPFMSLRHHVVAVPPPGALGAGKIKPGTAKPAASAARPATGKT